MSHLKSQKPRVLGSLQYISKITSEKLPTISKVLPSINPGSEMLKKGIQGNAMAVPLLPSVPIKNSDCQFSENKPKSTRNSVQQSSLSSDSAASKKLVQRSSISCDSEVSHKHCQKEIKEGLCREKELKDQIGLLQKELEELKVALKMKEENNEMLKGQLETQEKSFTEKLTEEKNSHESTKTTLGRTVEELDGTQERIVKMMLEHSIEMENQKEEFEKRLADAVEEKNATIADREHKLSRLKLQMADALKGNSWERQQQLEELTKELSRIQEEADMLRMKIKSISKSKQANCLNCDENSAKVSKLQSVIKEKESTIRELRSLCNKFESRVTTQDRLLEQLALSEGHKITASK